MITTTIKWLSIGLILTIIISLITPMLVKGQSPEVNSGAYQLMLKTLLDHSVPEISVDSAATQQGEVIFLDAREPSEYEVSHIDGSKLVGYDHFDMTSVEDIPKDQPIVVYCSVGYRSEKISEQLIAAGYQDVHNMYGGLFEWKNNNKDVVDQSGKTTQKVHAFNRAWGVWLKKGKKVY